MRPLEEAYIFGVSHGPGGSFLMGALGRGSPSGGAFKALGAPISGPEMGVI